MRDESDLFEAISDARASATMLRCKGRANVKVKFMRRKVGCFHSHSAFRLNYFGVGFDYMMDLDGVEFCPM